MALEIVVPELGESVTEATVAKWFKSVGDAVAVDEPLVDLETDKVTLEVNAGAGGILNAQDRKCRRHEDTFFGVDRRAVLAPFDH